MRRSRSRCLFASFCFCAQVRHDDPLYKFLRDQAVEIDQGCVALDWFVFVRVASDNLLQSISQLVRPASAKQSNSFQMQIYFDLASSDMAGRINSALTQRFCVTSRPEEDVDGQLALEEATQKVFDPCLFFGLNACTLKGCVA